MWTTVLVFQVRHDVIPLAGVWHQASLTTFPSTQVAHFTSSDLMFPSMRMEEMASPHRESASHLVAANFARRVGIYPVADIFSSQGRCVIDGGTLPGFAAFGLSLARWWRNWLKTEGGGRASCHLLSAGPVVEGVSFELERIYTHEACK